MRCHYEPVTDAARLLAAFGVTLPAERDARPGEGVEQAAIIVAGTEGPAGCLGDVRLGHWGLGAAAGPFAAAAPEARECRVETMKSHPTFRESWWAGRRGVVPVERLSAWCYATGRAEAWGVQRADGEPLALAGLWKDVVGADGERQLSFCVLTLDGTRHAVYGRMSHPLTREARMPAILSAPAAWRWLHGSLADAQGLLVPVDAETLQAAPIASTDTAAPPPRCWSREPDLFAEEWWRSALEAPPSKPAARPRGAVRARQPVTPGPVTADLFASAGDAHGAPSTAATS
jgi:putative SOS response-associated peptidase YedK